MFDGQRTAVRQIDLKWLERRRAVHGADLVDGHTVILPLRRWSARTRISRLIGTSIRPARFLAAQVKAHRRANVTAQER